MATTRSRRFIEKEKRPFNVFKGFPKSPRYKCKVINLEASGSDIIGGIRGNNFQIQDGAVVDLHPSQIECLRHATVETMKYEEDPITSLITQTDVERPRFMVTMLDMNPVVEVDDEVDNNKTEPSDKAKPVGKELAPKKVISGRK